MFFSKQKSTLGVDIGTSSIKIVQVTEDNGSFSLDTYGIVDIPQPLTVQSKPEEIEAVAETLKTLIKRAKVSTKRAVMSLPNSAVFTSVIDMPKLANKEMDSAMQYEAKKYVPLQFSEVNLSWAIISENEDGATVKVLLIAVPKQIKETYVKVFELAGLDLEIGEIEALALIRSLVTDPSKNDVIIDIGAKVTGINFIREGLLQMTRSLNIGGDTITDHIAQALNITPDRAEQFKKDFGLTGSDFLPESVKPVLGSIKNEVKQLMSIYRTHKITIDRIVLVGGGSQMPGIAQYFEDLGIEVVLGDSLIQMKYPDSVAPILERFKLLLPISVGLALRKET